MPEDYSTLRAAVDQIMGTPKITGQRPETTVQLSNASPAFMRETAPGSAPAESGRQAAWDQRVADWTQRLSGVGERVNALGPRMDALGQRLSATPQLPSQAMDAYNKARSQLTNQQAAIPGLVAQGMAAYGQMADAARTGYQQAVERALAKPPLPVKYAIPNAIPTPKFSAPRYT